MPSTAVSQLLRELPMLKQNHREFKIFIHDADITKFSVFIIGPEQSLYRHKLLKFSFKIPDNYPHVPPVVIFIQRENIPMHPTLHHSGLVCFDILGPGWSSSYNIHTILIAMHGHLNDYNPWTREEHGRFHDMYNKMTLYEGWRSLLADHYFLETGEIRAWVKRFIQTHAAAILADPDPMIRAILASQREEGPDSRVNFHLIDWSMNEDVFSMWSFVAETLRFICS